VLLLAGMRSGSLAGALYTVPSAFVLHLGFMLRQMWLEIVVTSGEVSPKGGTTSKVCITMQDGSPVGKKRTHRVRGASLSPRGRGEGEAGTADGTTEPDASSATTPEKAGEGSAAGVEEGAPDEDADSSAPLSPESAVSPRGLSRGDRPTYLHLMAVCTNVWPRLCHML